MFHIDYTYIFGREPHVKTLVVGSKQKMKLTPSIVDVMGGEKSRYFDIFKKQSQLVYNLLRKEVNSFYCICETLVETGSVTKEDMTKHFYKSFRPGEEVEDANIHVESFIKYSTQQRTIDSLMDKMHSACAMIF